MTDAALLADMRLPLLGLDMAALEAEVERLSCRNTGRASYGRSGVMALQIFLT